MPDRFIYNDLRHAFHLKKIFDVRAIFLEKNIRCVRYYLFTMMIEMSSDEHKTTLMNLKIGAFYPLFIFLFFYFFRPEPSQNEWTK